MDLLKKLEQKKLEIAKELKKISELNGQQKKKERKERNHKLIVLGTIFEQLGLAEESYDYLVGLILLSEPYKKTDDIKKEIESLGKEFQKRKKEYKEE